MFQAPLWRVKLKGYDAERRPSTRRITCGRRGPMGDPVGNSQQRHALSPQKTLLISPPLWLHFNHQAAPPQHQQPQQPGSRGNPTGVHVMEVGEPAHGVSLAFDIEKLQSSTKPRECRRDGSPGTQVSRHQDSPIPGPGAAGCRLRTRSCAVCACFPRQRSSAVTVRSKLR